MSITAPDGSVWPAGSLRAIEHQSIRDFVQRAADDGYLSGRVLDYGCGYAPYRSIVEEAGGEWIGYDRATFPDNHVGDIGEQHEVMWGRPPPAYNSVLCTQVIQYMDGIDLQDAIGWWRWWSQERKGHLVLTYPTNWPEAQPEDFFRFTKAGMERLLWGFEIIRHERRASISWAGEEFALGYGVIARA